MKPPRFEYAAPQKTDEAVALLSQHGDRAKVLAGGQSLVPLLNFRLARPEVLVDVNRVAELAYVRPLQSGVAIGALTRQHALERAEVIRTKLPIVAEACRLIGHLPIRHRGTLGGSLAHADPASELPAVMVALEAELTVARRGGQRTLPADQFFTGMLTTALAPDELLTEVRVPGLPPRTGGAFIEIARRAGDFALVGIAALVTLDDAGRVTRARLALCGAGPTPIRAREAERVLAGERPDARTLDEAAEQIAAATDPPSDIHASAAFRKKLARHVGRQAIELAIRRAGGAS
ncbi:MAG TPA: xanthine dehydrogenase family protein subunit M [Candidatus Acidoferrum sp.]|jgi:carbon-monoxide dehydrogenase medium subunit|nr:xanthine dehydrogenase family protein subunit M [Candidatus Acidoferrum sp.]